MGLVEVLISIWLFALSVGLINVNAKVDKLDKRDGGEGK